MRIFLAFLGISLLCLALAASGQNAASPSDKTWTAPADAASKQNPNGGKADAVTAGQKIFLRSCAECHGEDGTGLQEGVSNLQSPDVQKQTDGALFWKVTTGNVRRECLHSASWKRMTGGTSCRISAHSSQRDHLPVRISPPAPKHSNPN